MKQPQVYLVGAGPGDPELITAKGLRCLQLADMVVYDNLVNTRLLEHTREGCEHVFVGKEAGRHSLPQEEIQELLVREAKEGNCVVRLKGGDPLVFGRGGEEAEALAKEGISFEIVPGVTAALAAASYSGISLTHRDHASAVTFITGHENPDKHEPRVDFAKFAQNGSTLCIYMGMGQLRSICERLIDGGLAADTPVAVVRWATLQKQQSVQGTIATIADIVDEAELGPPALVFVGPVVQTQKAIGWFEQRPLFGKRIAITRRKEQAGELRTALEQAGAEVLELPLIEIKEAVETETFDDVCSELWGYRWLVFTSPNGVRYFMKNFLEKFEDMRSLGLVRIAAIGDATAREVRKHYLRVDLIPEEATSEKLAEQLLAYETLESEKVLLVTGNRNRDVLHKALEEAGVIVDALPVYATELNDLSSNPDVERFRSEGCDALVFASSSAVQSFADQAASLQLAEGAKRPKGVSFGPITAEKMKQMHVPVDIVSKYASIPALVETLIEAL